MTTTTVQLVVKTFGQQSVERLNKSLLRTDSVIKQVGRSLAGLALGAGLKEAFSDAENLERVEKGLVRIQKQYKQFAGIQNEATRLAKKFEVSVVDSGKALTGLASRLGAQGVNLDEITTVYEGVTSALIATNRSAAETSSTMYQLSQALGSGTLTGDELRTISETLPELLNEIALAAGKSTKEIRQMAKDGQLTTDVIIKAAGALKTKYGPAVADGITPSRKLANALEGLSETVGKRLTPIILPFVKGLTDMVNAFGQLPEPVQTALVGITLFTAALLALGPIVGPLVAIMKALGGAMLALGVGGASAKAVAGLGMMTKAVLILKGALLALPWVALAAGVTALGVVAVDYYQKQAKLNNLIQGGSDDIDEYKTAIAGKKTELEKASEKLRRMEKNSSSASRAINAQKRRVRELREQLELLEGTYDVKVRLQIQSDQIGAEVERRAKEAGGRAVGFDTLSGAGIREAIERANGTWKDPVEEVKKTKGRSGGGGGGGGSTPRESQIPELTRELELAQDLEGIQSRINEASLAGNEQLKLRLEGEARLRELMKEEADIKAEDIPEGERKLKLLKLGVDVRMQELETRRQLDELAKSEADAIQGALIPLQQQTELLQAKLEGREDEVRLLQEAENIARNIKGLEAGDVLPILQKNQALEEQIAAAKELEAVYKSVATAIASELTGAFKSIINGTKSVDEAFADMAKGIANKMLDLAMKMLTDVLIQQLMNLFKNLFSPVPSMNSGLPLNGFADGGRPPMNRPSLVGERGPELFVPDSAGTIIPNEVAFGDAQDAMTSESSSRSTAFADAGEAMAMASSTRNSNSAESDGKQAVSAIEQHITSGKSTVSFETYRVGEMDVVSREEALKIGMQSAKQAEANVYRGMRNMPAIRARTGAK